MSDHLVVDDNPDEHDIRFIEDQLNQYNVARTEVTGGRLLAIMLRDGAGLLAGLYGYTWGGVLEVRLLWVREDMRGQSYGSQLLAAAEREAMARGCVQAILDTHSFQAPAFYQRYGYEVYGVVPDYPPGHSKLYLRKSLHTATKG